MRETRAPRRGQLPILALDVVNHSRAGPAEQGRNDEPHPLPAPRWRERHDMLGSGVTQIAARQAPEKHPGIAAKARGVDFALLRPARRSVGRDLALLACAPERTADRRAAADEAARRRERAGLVEDLRRVSLKMIPPRKEIPRPIDRQRAEPEPWRAEFGLIAEHRGSPLRRGPDAEDHDREYDQNLADEQFGRGHVRLPPGQIVQARMQNSRLFVQIYMVVLRPSEDICGHPRPCPVAWGTLCGGLASGKSPTQWQERLSSWRGPDRASCSAADIREPSRPGPMKGARRGP